MIKNIRKISKSSNLVTEEYLDVRLGATKESLKEYIDVRFVETKDEIKEEIKEEIRGETAKILQGVDKIITRFDAAEKDHAAHTNLHKRITDNLHHHDHRIKKVEARV